LGLFTLRHSVFFFFCSGSSAVDPVDGTLNYVIALLLYPIVPTSSPDKQQLAIGEIDVAIYRAEEAKL
jgi:hypothetical protein